LHKNSFLTLKFPFYIARRYLFAKKSQTAVNVLTMVAVTGVSFGTMALIVVLSVFNGFENLILSLFNAFNPDMEITLSEGKTFNIERFPAEEIKKHPDILYLSEIYEEMALLTYRNKQHIVKLRGVDKHYRHITGVDTLMIEGEYHLQSGDRSQLVLGHGVALVLGANINDYLHPITIYVPRRGRVTGFLPAQAFTASSNYASGVFSVQAEFDMEYVIAPISLLRKLNNREEEVTSIMIGIAPGSNIRNVQNDLEQILGNEFEVKNRFQQQEFFYKVMQSEKWAIFFILSFILLIAAFNITGSLTMLILEKQRDIKIFRSMGASKKLVRNIFLLEGFLISFGGALLGLFLGWLISWIQIRYGIISIQAQGTFIVDAYPVYIKPLDFILVFFTVAVIGFLASLPPVWKIKYI